MAQFMESISDWFGIGGSEEELEQEVETQPRQRVEEEHTPVSRARRDGKPTLISLPTPNGAKTKIVLTEPEAYEDVQEMVAYLKSKQVVIVNLENTDEMTARQIIDFLSGAIYALEGSMRKIKEYVFVASPNTVEITNEVRRELQERTTPFWGR